MAPWFSHVEGASIKSVRKEKQSVLALERKGRDTSAINEQGIIQGLLPAVCSTTAMKKRGDT